MVDEFLSLAYYAEHQLPVVIFRLFNTVGPRQIGRYGMVIPRFIQQALAREPISVYSDGLQTRCFMHVHDTVAALMALSNSIDAIGEVFNVGATTEITILDLARTVLAVLDDTPELPPQDDPRIEFIPYEAAYAAGFEDMRRRVPDTTKIREHTGWQPQHDLRSILRDVFTDMRSSGKE